MIARMGELSRYLFLAGALPYIVLGLAHARATPRDIRDRKGLTASDPSLAEQMAKAHPLITRRTNIWLAWVGFNLSHSVGIVVFGVFVVLLGRDAATFNQNAVFVLPLAIVTSSTYLVLGINYWFKIPIAGCVISTACFVASAIARFAA